VGTLEVSRVEILRPDLAGTKPLLPLGIRFEAIVENVNKRLSVPGVCIHKENVGSVDVVKRNYIKNSRERLQR